MGNGLPKANRLTYRQGPPERRATGRDGSSSVSATVTSLVTSSTRGRSPRQAAERRTHSASLESLQRRSASEIILDPEETKLRFLKLVDAAERKILMLLPSQEDFRREASIGVVDGLERAAHRGVGVHILSPTDESIRDDIDEINEKLILKELQPIELTETIETKTPGTVTVLVVDDQLSLVVEQVRPLQTDFSKAIGSATFSSSEPTVRASIRFFERVKEEIALRMREKALLERERRNKRQSELLQDILAHDIRNYNQITMSCAEALKDSLPQVEEGLIDAIIRSTKGSTELLSKAVRLSRIVEGGEPELHQCCLEEAIDRALSLISNANRDRSITLASPLSTRTLVLADELLDEVFVNVFSNAVRYTDSHDVRIDIKVSRDAANESSPTHGEGLVSVSVTDHGRGVPDDAKTNVFTRFQRSSGGSGLGLSIVRALVVDRYGGRICIADRVPGDYSQGARLNIVLRSQDERRDGP